MVRSKSKTRGFTLIEMMVVVTIIGIVAASVAPGLSNILADGRQSKIAQQLLLHATTARTHAASRGIAHMVRFDATLSDGLGLVQFYEGMTASCNKTPWVQVGPVTPSTLSAYAELSLASANAPGTTANSAGVQVIKMRIRQASTTDVSFVELCYEPDGEVYHRQSAGDAFERQPPGSYTVRIERTMNNAARGTSRRIVFPAGAAPRMAR